MPTLILARHGRTTANASGILAGRSAGVHLDEHGTDQARRAAKRLAGLPLVRAVSSPLERCRETAELLVEGGGPGVTVEDRLVECDYGAWTGRPMKELAREELWRTVQAHPSGVRFPDGESMAEMSARAVSAVRDIDASVAAQGGADAIWLAVSHGDVIKAILADALGLHLDQFQRIVADPASLSVVHYAPERSYVLGVNSNAGSLSHLVVDRAERPGETVGGGAGSTAGV